MRSMQHATRNEKAAKIDRPRVLLQLRTGGVLEAVRVTRMGFPSRFIHRDFLHRFRVLAPLVTHADPRQHCVMLMGSLKPPLPTTDYQVRRWRSTPPPPPPPHTSLSMLTPPLPASATRIALSALTSLCASNPFFGCRNPLWLRCEAIGGSRCGTRPRACVALPSAAVGALLRCPRAAVDTACWRSVHLCARR